MSRKLLFEPFQPPQVSLPLTPLIGRARERVDAHALLSRSEVRLLTLTGPGGIGKTHLARQLAFDLAPDFAGGARFVSLAATSQAGQVLATIVRSLGVQESSSVSVGETLVQTLGDSSILIVLDNFEHVIAAAPLLVDVLQRCLGVKFIVTSRTLLRIGGEQVLPVPPLALPVAFYDESFEMLAGSPAVQVFTARAEAVDPAFAMTPKTAPLVADICGRLDGIPLAIELAAARLNHLSLPTLHDRLDRRLALLTGGARDGPERHRTLRDAIAWSYELLEPEEQVLFHRLAVFPGGCTLDAAEEVSRAMEQSAIRTEGVHRSSAYGPSILPVVDRIGALVDASLLRPELDPDGATRYRMLESIREFAGERLAASGEDDYARRAMAGYYLVLSNQHEPAPFLSDELQWLDRLEAERSNFQTALTSLETSGESVDFAQLAGALGLYWYVRGHPRRSSLARASLEKGDRHATSFAARN